MLLYDTTLQMFEYRGNGFNSFFYSLLSAQKEMKEIHNIDILTQLN